ncbi:hypothetical protein GGR51DRAFT_575599 [Nemania sp. FL0031]|nr:hypothetical protein GGR51DRAFT_575599 [Nemania sp. FL0031]
MAVLDEVPGIEVTIQINGQNVTEYDSPQALESDHHDLDSGCPTISKYVEAIDDTEFSIKVTVDDDIYAWENIDHVLLATVEIDGIWVNSRFLQLGEKTWVIQGSEWYSEESQQWYVEKVKFSAIKTEDNCDAEQIKKDIETVKNTGLIHVELERHVLENEIESEVESEFEPESEPESESELEPLVDTNTLTVAEKALKGKAISHSTCFSDNEVIMEYNRWSSHRAEEDSGPIAIFRFMYRSKEGLKQELVIPRTPSPSPPALTSSKSSSKSVDDMTVAELRRLAQERLDQINWAKEAKSRDKSTIKREVSEVVDVDEEAAKARTAKRPAVTIDLTDD